ncbi:hypothetical protein QP944_03775 [Corynebacterium sp. MSK105]|uniref:hypothetical protein n=1 Tax=unclassified Corynebacterium TaxID=2624378 RepID=UPI00254CE317|nr:MULTISPECIES: hypothetical protein [unclassified Corynebacterium]MDK8481904.1 hypothetical protein [Corynebacterium sp. MSK074]MDK8689664.1 hypothetical protein [Corynebacterium sp. MSK105]
MTFPIRRAWGPAAALIACALTLSACGDEDAANNSPTFVNTEARGTADPLYGKETTSAAPAASSAAPPASSSEPSAAAPAGDVQAVLDRIVAEHGNVGIAVSDGTTTIEAGRTAPEAAWSTSKVPVLIAANRVGAADSQLVSSAITYSDNEAAKTAWAGLGEGTAAAQATQSVIAEAGDVATQVQSQVTRPEFTAFGQTMWSVGNQAKFMAGVRCVEGAQPIINAMGVADPAQAYGLRTLPGTFMKGGWGPSPAGSYDVRQMGIVQLGGHDVAVALIASSPDGQYASTQTVLTSMAEALAQADTQWSSPAC